MSSAADPGPGPSATDLMDEYLAALERGEQVSTDELLQRAGEHSQELARRLGVLKGLSALEEIAQEEAAADLDPFPELERYRVLRRIGSGGFSSVYLAEDQLLQREVALKRVELSSREDGRVDDWLVTEGRSIARLAHANVVQVFDVGRSGDAAYISMEWVRGPGLDVLLDALRETRHSPETRDLAPTFAGSMSRCRLALGIARALEHCHGRDVLHRDVKPSNILLTEVGEPRLIDFGLAHLEGDPNQRDVTSRYFGTFAYLAPEQIDSRAVGQEAASDQFAFGVVLYELLTLTHPFRAEGSMGTLKAIERADPSPLRSIDPTIPADLELICLHCLEREPRERYASMAEVAEDLEALLGLRAISLEPPSPLRRARRFLRRHRRGAALVLLVLLALVPPLLWMGTGFGVRRSLSRRVEAATERLAATERPEDFVRLFAEQRELLNRARELDSSPATGWLFPPMEARLHGFTAAASNALHRASEGAYAILDDGVWRFAHRAALLTSLHVEWGHALRLEQGSVEHGPDELRLHALGTVELPAAGQTWRYEVERFPFESPRVALDSSEALEPGYYRHVLEGPAGPLEVDFELRALEPRRRIEPRPLAGWLEPRMRSVAPGNEDGVAPFRISDRITWSDLERGLEADLVATFRRVFVPGVGAALGDDDPGCVPWVIAQRYATAVGARLPTPKELWAARAVLDAGRVEGVAGEWTSATFGSDLRERYALRYSSLAATETPDLWESRADSPAPGTAFRVALSAATSSR